MDADAVFKREPALKSPEGLTFRPRSQVELFQVIDAAFHYRGDVTLYLTAGERVDGYVFNREAEADPPYLQVYITGKAVPRVLPYSEVVAVAYSGEDTAFGKSWEAWMSKKERLPKS